MVGQEHHHSYGVGGIVPCEGCLPGHCLPVWPMLSLGETPTHMLSPSICPRHFSIRVSLLLNSSTPNIAQVAFVLPIETEDTVGLCGLVECHSRPQLTASGPLRSVWLGSLGPACSHSSPAHAVMAVQPPSPAWALLSQPVLTQSPLVQFCCVCSLARACWGGAIEEEAGGGSCSCPPPFSLPYPLPLPPILPGC